MAIPVAPAPASVPDPTIVEAPSAPRSAETAIVLAPMPPMSALTSIALAPSARAGASDCSAAPSTDPKAWSAAGSAKVASLVEETKAWSAAGLTAAAGAAAPRLETNMATAGTERRLCIRDDFLFGLTSVTPNGDRSPVARQAAVDSCPGAERGARGAPGPREADRGMTAAAAWG
jgi:hypothetical protein